MDALPTYKSLKPIKTSRDVSNSEDGQPLSPIARLFHEPGSNVYIVGIFGSKTKIDPDVAKASLVKGLLKHPRFSSLQALDEETGEDTKTPLKGPVGGENNPRRVLKLTTSLDDVKLVKNAMNATINDVVLAVTEAGLSRYLNRRYGELENDKGPMKWKNYIPKNIRLRAIFYVNIRPAAGLQDLVAMMDKGSPARWGNKIGYVLLPFNIGLREDPLDYIHQAKAAINRKKASLESLFAYIFTKFLIKFFGSKVAGHLNYKVFCNTTLWFSNVPGTGDEIAFCGHELAYYAPTCCGQPNVSFPF
ncbi:O-acyltransferase (WSD1-like) family protein [Actinidia rufa]|uniref:O-acyltransferase (WSD1-like) family protein n=1 Tax=Actinidia rufa TaxID=165716 RepID=A0A7J0FLP5_9ERIC|nr:O-acyltransferase (WSD1-like) family protein [Actinidia rufa]